MTFRSLTSTNFGTDRRQSSGNADIEYKRDTYGNTDKDYGEFLTDISSFANTNGGDGKMRRPVCLIRAIVTILRDQDEPFLRLKNSLVRSLIDSQNT